MTIVSNSEAILEVRRLGLPQVFERILAGNSPEILLPFCEQPSTYYDLLLEFPDDLPPECKSLLPLWEFNGEAIVGLDLDTGQYIRYYYEDPSDELEVRGKNYQQLITRLLFDFVDAGLENEELRAISNLFDYHYFEAFLRALGTMDDQNYRGVRSEFVESVTDSSQVGQVEGNRNPTPYP